MLFPHTCTLTYFPELMRKRWQLIQSWASSFVLPKLWQSWLTFTVELPFMVGITVFLSNPFPCRHFLLKLDQNLLHPQECFTHVTMASILCIIMEKCWRTTAIGQMLRCVYLVVYNCVVCLCSLNRMGYV